MARLKRLRLTCRFGMEGGRKSHVTPSVYEARLNGWRSGYNPFMCGFALSDNFYFTITIFISNFFSIIIFSVDIKFSICFFFKFPSSIIAHNSLYVNFSLAFTTHMRNKISSHVHNSYIKTKLPVHSVYNSQPYGGCQRELSLENVGLFGGWIIDFFMIDFFSD